MSQPRESAMQRIQVGVFGLVAVLVVISVANVMYPRSAEEVAAATQSEEPELAADGEEIVPAEPLVELGVAPAVEAEPKAEESPVLSDAELDGPNTAPVE